MDYSKIECNVCKKMLSRQRTPKYFKTPERICILCNKTYCDAYKSALEENVCEINHETYYRKHFRKKNNIFYSLEHRTQTIEKDLKEFSKLFNGRDR